MPRIRVSEDLEINYALYDFTDPWKSADTILLVHGNSSNIRQWYAWIPRLSRDYKVLAFDLRGRGGSTVPPEGYKWSLEQYSEDIQRLLNALNLDKVFYVGNSLGGVIGIQFAYEHPERLKSLILCSTPYRFPNTFTDPFIRRLKEVGRENFFREDVRRLCDPKHTDPGLLEWMVSEMAKTSLHVTVSSMYFNATINLENTLPKITVPTLILAPAGSDRAPLGDTEYMSRKIPNAKLVVLEESGSTHSIIQQVPDRCIDEVLKFIRAL